MEILILAVLLLILLAGGAAAFFAWQAYKQGQAGRGGEQAFSLLQQQLEGLRAQVSETISSQAQTVNQQLFQVTSQVGQQLDSISRQVMESQKSVGQRLDNAAKVVGEVQKTLGTLGQMSERIFEVGKDMAGLQEILRAPKLRGGLGEYFLGDLLGQILPAKHFALQHAFRTGAAVDAVIRLGGKLVPVDSKFPLENFRRLLEAKTDEERKPLKKKFATDVKKHVDAIAEKYILPAEGTYDFALMYIPAENVYYECIVKEEEGQALAEYALQKRVIPVSPACFYAYLQAIILGLKGFQIEENARLIMQNLAQLQGDFQRFIEEFEVLGGHLTKAKGKHEDAVKSLERFHGKLSSVAEAKPSIELQVETPLLPPARDASRP